MVYPRDIVEKIINIKGYTLNDLDVKLNRRGDFYRSFRTNIFSDKLLERISEIIGEDLSMYANSATSANKGG